MNPLKKKYFVSAVCTSTKKGSSRKTESHRNMVIDFWRWQPVTPKIVNNVSAYMAKLVEEQTKDIEVKEMAIISMNRV